MEKYEEYYKECRLCARLCGIDRTLRHGACGEKSTMRASRASLHLWEEPPISGTRGSGTVFFSGCSLGCIYCQNRAISRGDCGIPITPNDLAETALRLQKEGAHNLNLVTPTHFAPSVREGVLLARERGFILPVVYNTSSYDSPEALSLMDGIVDIYLPDLKYFRESTARAYSAAPNYPTAARAAIAEMVRQTGAVKLDADGLMLRGTVIRILLLPGHLAEAKLNLSYVYKAYGDSVCISLMSQYTPIGSLPKPLDRRVSRAEYRELVDYAEALGVRNAFIQESGAAEESFIPDFDDTGLLISDTSSVTSKKVNK